MNLNENEREVLRAIKSGGESISGTALFSKVRLTARELSRLLEMLKDYGFVESYNPESVTIGHGKSPSNSQPNDQSTRYKLTSKGQQEVK